MASSNKARGVVRPLALAVALSATGVAGQGPPAPVIQPSNPADVASAGVPIDRFDDFSWQMFLTMVWPADAAHRGQPDLSRPLDAPGPLVFESFRTNSDVFLPGGAAPSDFDTNPATSPCGNMRLPANALVLVGFAPLEEFRLADFGPLAGPLITQHRTYTRFATGYNRIQFDHIRSGRLYLKPATPSPVTFPDGATMVKSAWIEMSGIADPERYHTRMAWVKDPGGGGCVERKVGLVGLHIVKKTPMKPQWIWTTFEHVDTVPDGGPRRPFIYNDGSGTPMAARNPYDNPLPVVPSPQNVDRVKPIHAATMATNDRYRQALPAGSVWRNYQLVMTQWPLSVSDPTKGGGAGNSFPGNPPNDATAFANTTMEPYEQRSVASSGCMACHNRTRTTTDFVWALTNRAVAPPSRNLSARLVAPARSLEEIRRTKAEVERAERRAAPR